ncbi:MAG: Maf family protein [Paracoccaceae bacterium]
MTADIILASGSEARQAMLTNAGVSFNTVIARVDEEAIRQSMLAEGASTTDIADALAEAKARKVSLRNAGALVIGCDQILDLGGSILSKAGNIIDGKQQLTDMNGVMHKLLSAAVIYQDGQPQWRHVGTVRMHMRRCSDAYLDDYLDRNWESVRHCVGCYKLEEEGVRLFSRIEGDYFSVLGLPLTELLGYLTIRGVLPE